MLQKLFDKLTDSPPLRKKIWKFWYDFAHLVDGQKGDLRYMNFGYAPEDNGGKILDLDAADERHRNSIQMYYHAVGRRSLAGSDVMEVGCGRGGGAASLMKYAHPRSLVGIDLSPRAIAFNRKSYNVPSLSFRQGDAERLPFPDASFDAVLNVESSHCYPRLRRFFDEVRRVLRPGGRFFYVDFRGQSLIAPWLRHIRESGFLLRETEDISRDVVRALTLDSRKKEELIQKRIPVFLRRYFRKFSCTAGSENYVSLSAGSWSYYRFFLEKPAA